MLGKAKPGGTFLLELARSPDEVWDKLPREVQQQIIDKKLKFYVIDAQAWREDTGMGGRINTIMQTCFFAITGVLPRDEAIAAIKDAIKKTYGKTGEEVVQQELRGRRQDPGEPPSRSRCRARDHQRAIAAGRAADSAGVRPARAPRRHDRRQGRPAAGERLPRRRHLADGHDPVGEAQHRRGNPGLGREDLHPVQQVRASSARTPRSAPRSTTRRCCKAPPRRFKTVDFKAPEFKGMNYTIQVAPEDCTGCDLCVTVCPAKDKANPKHKAIDMAPQPPLREAERANYDFFLDLPEVDRTRGQAATSRARSSSSRSSSTPAPAPAAARRRTSSCSPSSSATAL